MEVCKCCAYHAQEDAGIATTRHDSRCIVTLLYSTCSDRVTRGKETKEKLSVKACASESTNLTSVTDHGTSWEPGGFSYETLGRARRLWT